jgi:hypothetical protein
VRLTTPRFSGRGSPPRYGRPLNWLPASRLLPRGAGWSAATLCIGRVGVWRGGCRLNISVAGPFVWRCLTGSALAPFPHSPGGDAPIPGPSRISRRKQGEIGPFCPGQVTGYVHKSYLSEAFILPAHKPYHPPQIRAVDDLIANRAVTGKYTALGADIALNRRPHQRPHLKSG